MSFGDELNIYFKQLNGQNNEQNLEKNSSDVHPDGTYRLIGYRPDHFLFPSGLKLSSGVRRIFLLVCMTVSNNTELHVRSGCWSWDLKRR